VNSQGHELPNIDLPKHKNANIQGRFMILLLKDLTSKSVHNLRHPPSEAWDSEVNWTSAKIKNKGELILTLFHFGSQVQITFRGITFRAQRTKSMVCMHGQTCKQSFRSIHFRGENIIHVCLVLTHAPPLSELSILCDVLRLIFFYLSIMPTQVYCADMILRGERSWLTQLDSLPIKSCTLGTMSKQSEI
jgi:hypothetical protein